MPLPERAAFKPELGNVEVAGAEADLRVGEVAGIELTVAGQVVAPFLLTQLLLPALLAAAPSRVITVSSAGMYTQRLHPAALEMPASSYHGVTAYARVKRAQVALSMDGPDASRRAMSLFTPCTPAGQTRQGWPPGYRAFTGPCGRFCAHPARAPTPSSGSPALIRVNWAADDSGMTGGPDLSTGSHGPVRPGPDVARQLWESVAERVPA